MTARRRDGHQAALLNGGAVAHAPAVRNAGPASRNASPVVSRGAGPVSMLASAQVGWRGWRTMV
jgi:hypothetical protein